MKKIIFALLSSALVGCSAPPVELPRFYVKYEMFTGTWQCVHQRGLVTLNAYNTYSLGGKLTARGAMSIQSPDAPGNEPMTFAMTLNGTWTLDQNVVYEYIHDFSIEPLNRGATQGKSIQAIATKMESGFTDYFNENKQSSATIIDITHHALKKVSEKGNVIECQKVAVTK